MNSYFILSSARSGSTSLAKILNTSTNSICQSEPMPNLNVETRLAMDGKLSDEEVEKAIDDSVVKRVREFSDNYEVYGEKNLTFAPFITKMYEKLGCKFIFLKRDGRDVVTSMMNWHEHKFGDFYKEANSVGNPTNDALSSAKNLLAYQDTSDYSRPRPQKHSDLYYKWSSLSRFEMCSYYWNNIYKLYIKELNKLPEDSWFELDYTNNSVENMLELGEFLGLKGFERIIINEMLNNKINSLEDRGHKSGKFPKWVTWDSSTREKFERFAQESMIELGYFSREDTYWKPKKYTVQKETIENTYDVKQFLIKELVVQNGNIDLILHRGYFPESDNVEYNYNTDGYFYNDIGVLALERYLKELGCKNISITPIKTGKDDIIYETKVVAHV